MVRTCDGSNGWSANSNTESTKASNNWTEAFWMVLEASICIPTCCNSLNIGCLINNNNNYENLLSLIFWKLNIYAWYKKRKRDLRKWPWKQKKVRSSSCETCVIASASPRYCNSPEMPYMRLHPLFINYL